SFRIYLSLECFNALIGRMNIFRTLKSWQRVKDQSGNPKGFGFAEYAVYHN
ncbi:hypothetical protein GLOIN_2v1712434, partial [Rhizophagus irregularis DAOM 181602=DAOM 197198]